jgi:hypothetical protein
MQRDGSFELFDFSPDATGACVSLAKASSLLRHNVVPARWKVKRFQIRYLGHV